MGDSKKEKVAFGDFQTPSWFCNHVCALLVERGFNPSGILEPTCGEGNFLLAALNHFPSVKATVGIDINENHIGLLRQKLECRKDKDKVDIIQADFFNVNWRQILGKLPEPLLVIGNPPWVTNSQLSLVGSNNLPKKSNFQNHAGIDAITGAGNFDISEWMLLRMIEWAENKQVIVAMLCKTAVARKILLQTWQKSDCVGSAEMFLIDSKKIFNAAVDACLLIYNPLTASCVKSCKVFANFSGDSFLSTIGYRNGQIVANLEYFENWKHLQNKNKTSRYHWRSGIKHDCASVMELEKKGEAYVNNLGETYELEDAYLFPMLKSSDLANNSSHIKSRWMLVTQRVVGESTLAIKSYAPKTWAYLVKHLNYFERRKSAIYKDRPPYSVFGVGDYTFFSWKVAISGLYKRLSFAAVGPQNGKPTVFDDTCYFLPCKSKDEAEFIAWLLNSETAQQFFQSFIFWDAKRPITAKILNKLNLNAIAQEFGYEELLESFATQSLNGVRAKQLRMLEKAQISEQYKA